MSNLKKNIIRLTRERELSMAQLARETKIPPQTLNNWMAGQEPRSITQLKRVADFFMISLDELCFGSNSHYGKALIKHSEEINAGIFEVVLRRIQE